MTQRHDLPNPDLLERIPLNAGSVLDVGCSTGALLSIYRRYNPRARLLGIDNDPECASLARTRLDDVAQVDVEIDPLPFELERPLDCIIYGDVLEHLRDPWAVLRRHAEALSDDGVILVCVPNMEHWSFAERLLRGTWDYEAAGLFDETHLRWFSLDTLRKGMEAIGLYPCDVRPRIFDAKNAEAFANKLAPGLKALGIDPQNYAERSAPLQFVWRVRKQPRPPILNIVSNMLQPVGGVSHVRIVYPLQTLNTDPAVMTRVATGGEMVVPGGDAPRIYVLHRPTLIGDFGAKRLRDLLAEGWVIVTEFDDHPDHFGMLDASDQYAFRGVHAVQTSTPVLASILRGLNPEVALFANTIRNLPDVRNFVEPNVVTLFFGALNREKDWAPFIPVLNAVAEKAGERLRFSVVHDQQFFEALHTPHKQFTPTCDHDTYMNLLGQSEISFMPLGDTPFNRAKSDLKFIEAGACRVASLASPVVYADSIEDGRTGVLFRSPEELRDRLLRLVAMPDLARSLGDAARHYVASERMMAYQVNARIAWYRSLWARREELTNALYARMMNLPELSLAKPAQDAYELRPLP
ncbi:MAG TPA: methyltransferase domain-containing protein [Acetobacteraceae bacterium]|jgi:SAM-dependent methyltransferase|nr:methyltransferase domain-containing protein [Acetobacteraceae bacterium]